MKKQLLFILTFVFSFNTAQTQQAIGILDINNIHCNVSATGDLFNRFDDETLPGFEVPAGSGLRTIYAGNLWIGGISPDQQLKLAAETYQAIGQDWFTGPLTIGGAAEISDETEAAYNQVWVANSADVEAHIAYFYYLENGGDNPFPNGYILPEWFLDWPAHGNVELGQAFYLAPFVDHDGDMMYNPFNGDYPLFCGEQCVYFIFNDKGNVHSESQGQPIGLEIHGMLYGFNSTQSEMLNNTVFLKYKIINRGTQTLVETNAGLWTDFDLGNANDDYIGTNVARSAVYAYNGDNLDEGEYEDDLPMQALVILAGPRMDSDEQDGPLPDETYSGVTDSYGEYGWGYGDGSVDNERCGLNGSVYYNNNSNPINGEPSVPIHYYNYLSGYWLNGEMLAFDDDNPYSYMFYGMSDPLYTGTFGVEINGWDEISAGNPPGDRRIIASMGSFTLNPGDIHFIDVAYIFARESDEDDNTVAETLEQRMIEAKLFFNEFLVECNGQSIALETAELTHNASVNIYPNPASGNLFVEVEDQIQNARITMFDVTGKLVFETQLVSGVNQIPLNMVGRGIYTVCISEKRQSTFHKVVLE